jgi:hypothetical protein
LSPVQYYVAQCIIWFVRRKVYQLTTFVGKKLNNLHFKSKSLIIYRQMDRQTE